MRLFPLLALLALPANAQRTLADDAFRQLDELLPSPNRFRTASGAPGPDYWQQRADYDIDVTLDEEARTLTGKETIRYWNRSPDTLEYLWLQLDQNRFAPDADGLLSQTAPSFEHFPYRALEALLYRQGFQGGYRIESVRGADGSALPHTVVKTMMRIDLPEPLAPDSTVSFTIEWHHPIPEARLAGARGGFEHFDRDDNCIFGMAQWYPRMAAYTDYTGWQHKQFLGSGEFTLEFGNFHVRITVPDDHVVAATGLLQNPGETLEPEWRERLEQAQGAREPVFIVTPDEARERESSRPKGTKTWEYRAENVRDFAWASSRKFIWDAMGVDAGDGRRVTCMSFYPNEGEPLWSRYSTHAVAHTLEIYGQHAFPYPYPVAISVNGIVGGGMEYPMICFNGPRPAEDGTYSKRMKYRLISVIIHEVGHNWFPMVVNSDERQWTWMDEGLNTFCEYLAEQAWEDGYPSRAGEPADITGYMTSKNQVPVMTNSESLLQFGNNAYSKPTTALNILRETVMGRELFDFAFRTYARRWMFKRPQPADLFRTLEDASAIDLDWFWRGWFYTTDHVDVAVGPVHEYQLDRRDPEIDKAELRAEREAEPETLAARRNAKMTKRLDRFPELADFYNEFDDLAVTEADRKAYEKLLADLDPDEAELLHTDRRFYVVEFDNLGGLVTPLILQLTYADGSTEEVRLPAEIWRKDPRHTSKLFVPSQEIVAIELDPHLETADTDTSNNRWPARVQKSRFQLFKEKRGKNPMQEARDQAGESAAHEAAADGGEG